MGTTSIFLDGRYDPQNLDFYKRGVAESDYVIAADGGVLFLNSLRVVPDLLVGDGDSCDFASVEAKEKIKHSADKNQTDGEIALQEAMKRMPGNRIKIYGGLVRLEESDHFLGNLGMLYSSSRLPGQVSIHDPSQDIYVASEHTGSLVVKGNANDTISLAAYGGQAEGVVSEGLKWEVDSNVPVGVGQYLRNRLAKKSATISVRKGTLLVFHYKR